MSNRNRISCLIAVVSVAFAWMDNTTAQTTRSGEIEIGQQALAGDSTSSKFEEYRTSPSGTILNRFRLSLDNTENSRYLNLEALRVAQPDQSLSLSAGIAKKLQINIDWDQTPHLLGLNGRSVFTQPVAGVYTLPLQTRKDLNKLLTTDTDPSRSGVQPDLAAISDLVNGTARHVDLRTQRKTATVALRYTPVRQENAQWDLRFQYKNEDRSGSKPMGATFQFGSINELPQPLDYRTQEIRMGTEYSAKRWTASVDYTGSFFKNEVSTLVWDNPFQITDAVSRPTFGRLDLFPDNTSHNIAFAGSVRLPMTTRVSTSVSYGWRSQNDPFLPYTTNTAVEALSTFPSLPATSLNGKVNVLTSNFALASRPYRSVSVNARYRLYDYDNKSPSLFFPRYVGYGDYQLSTYARQNLPIAHKRQNAGLDVGYHFMPGATFKIGYGWEQWNRSFRDAPKTDENTLQTALTFLPNDWASLRTAYARSWRKTHDYNFEKHVGHFTFPEGEGLGTFEPVLPELRRFDMASRVRDRFSLTSQFTPVAPVTFTSSVGYALDDFNESEYGLLNNRGVDFSIGVDINPLPQVTFFGVFTREDYRYEQRSRQRTPPSGSNPANDRPDNDWRSDQKDIANTLETGISGVLIERTLDGAVSYVLSDTRGKVTTQALGNGTLLTTVENYPGIRSRIHQFVASFRYRLSASVFPRVEYRYEKYQESYFSQTKLNPFMGTVDSATASSTFLGATQPGYNAHVFSLLVGYSF